MRPTNVIQAENLTKVYEGVRVVDNVSFSVAQGEIFGFLGPNAAGKTTTIKMLNTLAVITEGRAKVAGHDVATDPGGVRRSIGVVPQELTADDELSGMENIMLMARLHQVGGSFAKERMAALLKLVDLEQAARLKVRTFSGGMRRRLQLVMALVHEPEVLFLDEPTLGLDVQTRSKMWQYIRRLSRERGLTVFMTTHYLDEADSLCDRIAIIDRGTIRASGTPAELKASHGDDIITLTLVEGSEDLTALLSGMAGVASVARDGRTYTIKLPRGEKVLPAIVASVVKKETEIEDVAFSKPTLDQVFLDVVGRSMREQESSGSASGWENMRMKRVR